MKTNPPQPVEDDPTLPALRDFWLERGKDLVKESVKTIDETARQVITIAGILEGLYFHAIAFANLRGKLQLDWQLVVYLLPILFLLLSLAAALLVFFPKVYELEMRSWEGAKLIHQRTLKRKRQLLAVAATNLVIGVAGLFGAVLIYLLG